MYVSPKRDCPHVDINKYIYIEEFKKIDFLKKTCRNCPESSENWICLTCGELYCSRYINSHFYNHYVENISHSVCLSTMDLSFWCYECDSYIIDNKIQNYYKCLSDSKFGRDYIPELSKLTSAMEYLKIEPNKAYSIKYYNFIEMLKTGKFKKISFLTGAGISTTAGIPDFRSSENGLFKTMQEKYNLETPEQFFDIEFFKHKPELFYEFAKEFDLGKYKATYTHWFMSFLNHKDLLHLIFTQNIDSLELNAKIPKEKIVFAHGNLSESHCSICNKEADHKLLTQHIQEGKILYCNSENCKGPVKPKVIFYGEKLDSKFFDSINALQNSDLAIIMGTSLKVMPFNMLPYQIGKSAWRVVVNREKVGHFNYDDVSSTDIFIEGTTDDQILKILEDCGWKEEFTQFIKNN